MNLQEFEKKLEETYEQARALDKKFELGQCVFVIALRTGGEKTRVRIENNKGFVDRVEPLAFGAIKNILNSFANGGYVDPHRSEQLGTSKMVFGISQSKRGKQTKFLQKEFVYKKECVIRIRFYDPFMVPTREYPFHTQKWGDGSSKTEYYEVLE